jgi:hypothetical protein
MVMLRLLHFCLALLFLAVLTLSTNAEEASSSLSNFLGFFFSSPARAQFQPQMQWGGIGSGTANAQTVNVSNVSGLSDILGVAIEFIPLNTNNAATTLTASGLPPQPVKKPSTGGLIALSGNEFIAGQLASVIWDGAEFVLNGWSFSPAVAGVPTNIQLWTTHGTYSYVPTPGAQKALIFVTGAGGGSGKVAGGGRARAGRRSLTKGQRVWLRDSLVRNKHGFGCTSSAFGISFRQLPSAKIHRSRYCRGWGGKNEGAASS